jgi:tryptophan-rich sensory protein
MMIFTKTVSARVEREVGRVRHILSHPLAYAFILVLAALITHFSFEVEGAILFVFIVSLYLFFFDDLITVMLPFLLLCTFTLKCYDSFDTFFAYKWAILPAAISVGFHFIHYKKPFTRGENFSGVCAVALAVTLGGLFSISLADYFRLAPLYHVFALGIGMIFGYLAFRASLFGRPIGESAERFLVFMYLWGAFAAYMVFHFIIMNYKAIGETGELPYFQWSNNIATVLMLTMPFPFYFALKNPLHLLPGYLMYLAVLLSTSRGGILFGTAEIIIITVYVIFAAKSRASRFISIGTATLAAAVLYKNLLGLADILNFSTITDGLIESDEARVVLIRRSIEDFKSNILFGRGLGYTGNTDAYDPKKGALYFYHMMLPQIIGSMGLCGVFSYLWQFVVRIRTIAGRITPLSLCLFISYLGLFMMSQVNPGEFVPLPYSFVATCLFVIMELHPHTE